MSRSDPPVVQGDAACAGAAREKKLWNASKKFEDVPLPFDESECCCDTRPYSCIVHAEPW